MSDKVKALQNMVATLLRKTDTQRAPKYGENAPPRKTARDWAFRKYELPSYMPRESDFDGEKKGLRVNKVDGVQFPDGSTPKNPYKADRTNAWAAKSAAMLREGHPFTAGTGSNKEYVAGPSPVRNLGGVKGSMEEKNVKPWIYNREGFRKPLNEAMKSSVASPRDYRDLAERTKELATRVDMDLDDRDAAKTGAMFYQAGFKGGTPRIQVGKVDIAPNERLPKGAKAPRTSVATHEYEHALDDAQGALTGILASNPKGGGKKFTARYALNTGETPAVLAETVAGLRHLNEKNPAVVGGLSFGVPGYNTVSGRFIHDQGSRYMYGRDASDRKIAPQRSMSDLLSTTEAAQWLKQMARKKSNP
jgi:hypothetical protein